MHKSSRTWMSLEMREKCGRLWMMHRKGAKVGWGALNGMFM